MNVWIIKYISILLFLLTFSKPVKAQKLGFLIPDGAVIQHAGSIGYFSGGIN